MEVGEQRDREPELLAERRVAGRGVDADPDQRGVAALDLAEDLLVDRELVGADRAEVERIEGEHEPAARRSRESETRLPSWSAA